MAHSFVQFGPLLYFQRLSDIPAAFGGSVGLQRRASLCGCSRQGNGNAGSRRG